MSAGKSNGNTLTALGVYQWNYEIQQGSLELKWKRDDLGASVYFEVAKNAAAKDHENAHAVGAQVVWDRWTLGLANINVDADAVLALFTDSDFAGGQTASRGTVASLSYKLNSNVSFAGTVHAQTRARNTAAAETYDRSHLDISISF